MIISPILCCCLVHIHEALCLAHTSDTREGGDVEHCQLVQAVKSGLWLSKKKPQKTNASNA